MKDHKSTKGKPRIMWWERGKPNPVNYFFQISAPATWQKHHVLPCTSVKTSINKVAGKADKEYLESALKFFTKWNINDAHNLIPLPTRTTYVKAYGKRGGKEAVAVVQADGRTNLPVHLWAHWKYNLEVEKELLQIWSDVSIKLKKCEELTSESMSGRIKAKVRKWKGTFPGLRRATQANWKKAVNGVPHVHNHFTMFNVGESPF